MQKMLLKLFAFSFTSLTFSNCSNNHSAKNLENWVGDYRYEETPIEANAGYAMVMDWNLSIDKQNDTVQGVLDVIGQQTFAKLKAIIKGDTSKIAIVYDKLLDGTDEQLKQGDTLFTLTKASGELKTKWFALEPRLLDNPPEECNCFEQAKNSSR